MTATACFHTVLPVRLFCMTDLLQNMLTVVCLWRLKVLSILPWFFLRYRRYINHLLTYLLTCEYREEFPVAEIMEIISYWFPTLSKGWTIQPKLDRTDPVKSATFESAIQFRSDMIPTMTFHGPSENNPLANESVKRCTNGVVHATPLSAADIGCFRLSINHVRLQPAPFIGHRVTGMTAWSANHRVHDVSALLIGAVPGTKQ